MTTRTGDVLTTETEIAALPHGSVILDSHGNAAQKVADQWHYPETNPVPDKRVAKYAPATILHVPGKQQGVPGILRQEPPTRDEIARAIANHYGTRAGRDNAWDATTDRQRTELLGVADAVLALLEGRKR